LELFCDIPIWWEWDLLSIFKHRRPPHQHQQEQQHPGATTTGNNKKYHHRGSISQFNNHILKATRTIRPGMELFIDVGGGNDRKDDSNVLSIDDYEKIDQVIDKSILYFEKYGNYLDEDSKQVMYKLLVDDIIPLAIQNEKKTNQLQNMLPTNVSKIMDVINVGGSLLYSKMITINYFTNEPPSMIGFRTVPWLQANGYCMDNLRSRRSLSTGAFGQRGAFTTRTIHENDILAPVPLIHIPDVKRFLQMTPTGESHSCGTATTVLEYF
jgi:hypothetical protein